MNSVMEMENGKMARWRDGEMVKGDFLVVYGEIANFAV